MKIFFDTEFTGLHKNTTLISVGLIAEDGTQFYAEFNDYDKNQIDNWIQCNVVDNLILTKNKNRIYNIEIDDNVKNIHKYSVEICGDKQNIKIELNRWLSQFDNVEWVSDVCHYDFVLLIDLLYNSALNIPYGVIGSSCHDINQDIANFCNINELQAFDKSREDILSDSKIKIDGNKHNSLYDAKVIKSIYEIIFTN